MNRLLLIIFILYHCILFVNSQEKETIQLTGIITNIDKEVLSFVHAINQNRHTGYYSDLRGIYSILAQENDTIIYTCIGYKPQTLIVPDTLPSSHFTADILMIKDTIAIDEIIVLPWKTYEEFKRAFIALELPDDDMERARKNIALMKVQILLNSSPTPNSNFRKVMQEEYNKTFIQGQYPSISLLNPQNWSKFINAIQNGDFMKKE